MEKIVHPKYKDYPEQPYISPSRDLKSWEENPEDFPYGVVERRQMIRTEEGLLPGDVVMLWRIHFGNFTTKTWIPEYFEYRYGINWEESIQLLHERGFVRTCSAKESLTELNVNQLKDLLRKKKLPLGGKREDVLARVREEISEEQLEEMVKLRKYAITHEGSKVLSDHEEIIKRHGPKNL